MARLGAPQALGERSGILSVFSDNYVETFASLRTVPEAIRLRYAFEALHVYSPGTTIRLCDVGAGIGLFAESFVQVAERLQLDLDLTLVEPSAPMRSHLVDRGVLLSSNIVPLTLEEFARTAPAQDLVFISDVAHLLGCPNSWLPIVTRLLPPSAGRVLIRTGVKAQVARRNWYACFPRAREIDVARHPSSQAIVAASLSAGLHCNSQAVDESRWVRRSDFLALMEQRGFSSFRLLDDYEHRQGMDCLRRETAASKMCWLEYEMTLFDLLR